MSQLPETRQEMLRARYKFLNRSECRRCHRAIEWWETTRGKKLPFDAPANPPESPAALREFARVHSAECDALGKTLFDRMQQLGPEARKRVLEEIGTELGARLVLVLDDEGYAYAVRLGLNPEDVKHELITAANEIRREMGAGR